MPILETFKGTNRHFMRTQLLCRLQPAGRGRSNPHRFRHFHRPKAAASLSVITATIRNLLHDLGSIKSGRHIASN
jgi:hypothetical protein